MERTTRQIERIRARGPGDGELAPVATRISPGIGSQRILAILGAGPAIRKLRPG